MTPAVAAETDKKDDKGSGGELNRWTVAAAGTRTAAKWMIGSLAAAAALIFGAGPMVTRPELSWQDNRTQLLVALGAGAVGFVSLVLLIGQIATVLTPRKVSLDALPKALLQDIDAAADIRLPSGANSYKEFLANFGRYKVLVGKFSAELARVDTRTQDGKLGHAQLTHLLQEARENVEVYTRATEGILNQAEFYGVTTLFDGRRRTVAVILAIMAALGALAFQLALAAGPKPMTSAKVPELAYLVAPTAPNQLWDSLKLVRCTIGGRVPVLVSGGNGSPDNPYAVTVLRANDSCDPVSFDMRADALVLEKISAQAVTVQYQSTT